MAETTGLSGWLNQFNPQVNQYLGSIFKMAPGPAYELSGPGLQSRRRRAAAGESALAGRVQNEPLTSAQLQELRDGQNSAIRAYQNPAGGTSAPPVLSDDADTRASEARRMLQQATPYWEREENQGIRTAAAVGGGPRAGEAGYAQRADIQAWMEANKNAPKGADGKNIVDRFLEQQQKRGLIGTPGLGGTQYALPVDSDSEGLKRAELTQQIFQAAAQGKLPDLGVDAEIPKNVDLAFSRTAGIPGTAAFTGLEVAQPFSNPEVNRQFAALAQPAAVQAIATGTGGGTNLQPASAAASETGVEPAQPDAPGNKPNPADDLARRYIDTLRTTRAARLGA